MDKENRENAVTMWCLVGSSVGVDKAWRSWEGSDVVTESNSSLDMEDPPSLPRFNKIKSSRVAIPMKNYSILCSRPGHLRPSTTIRWAISSNHSADLFLSTVLRVVGSKSTREKRYLHRWLPPSYFTQWQIWQKMSKRSRMVWGSREPPPTRLNTFR